MQPEAVNGPMKRNTLFGYVGSGDFQTSVPGRVAPPRSIILANAASRDLTTESLRSQMSPAEVGGFE